MKNESSQVIAKKRTLGEFQRTHAQKPTTIINNKHRKVND